MRNNNSKTKNEQNDSASNREQDEGNEFLRPRRDQTELSVSIHEAGHAFAVWSIGESILQLSINMQGGIINRWGIRQSDHILGQSEHIPEYRMMGFPTTWVSKMDGITIYAGRFAEQLLCDDAWTARCVDPITAFYDIVDPESDDLRDDEEELIEISHGYPYSKMRQLEKYWATQVWNMINNNDAKRTISSLAKELLKKNVLIEEEIDWFIGENMNQSWRYPKYHLIPKTVRMKAMGSKLFKMIQFRDKGKWQKLDERFKMTGSIWPTSELRVNSHVNGE